MIAVAKILILKFWITQQFVVKWIAEMLQFEKLPQLIKQNLLQILINQQMTLLIKLTPQLLAFVFKFVFFNDQLALKRFYFLVLILLHSIKLPQPRLNNLQKQYTQLHKVKHIILIKIRHNMRLQNLFQKFIKL